MEPSRQKITARFLLIVFSALGLFWLSRIDYAQKISTNVIDLVPADERSPEITLLRSLADERQARVVLLALADPAHPNEPPPEDAAVKFAAALRASPLFAEATPLKDAAVNNALGAFLYQRRLDLLLPTWLSAQDRAFAATGQPEAARSAWLSTRIVDGLDAFLLRPEATAFQEIVQSDPLLLVPSLVLQTQSLAASTPAGGHSLVWARLAVSPLDEAGQAPVFAVIDQALADLQSTHPGLTLQWSGVNRFAAASKERIRGELEWLNILSMIAVLAVAVLFVRRPWKSLHLVPVILFSILGGWVAATMAFERIHILVFVVGALLTGVAIDYGFYLYLQPALHAGERYREKLARLMKPLLTSCLTTVIGFSFLLFSELPLIRQLGVFVSAGLISALAGAILYFAQLNHPYLEARNFAVHAIGIRHRNVVRILGIIAIVISAVGPWLLNWQDNIRQLDVPNTSLNDNDREVRSYFGDTDGRAIYITRGDSITDARDRLEAFQTWHTSAFPDTSASSMGLVLPTHADFTATPARIVALSGFESQLRATLEQRGYTADSFDPFFNDWRALAARSAPPAYDALAADLQSALTGPLGMLFFTSGHSTWFLTIADHEPGSEPPPELGTVGTNQLETLNSLFGRYRASALRLSIMGLSLIGISVFVLYGIRRGLRIFIIPCGSCLFTFGLLGFAGNSLNMFHLLGAFLGVCLSHNYAIFSAENAGRGEPPPISIRLSALTTAASFGVLALSKIPVVSALGSTVALIVITALVMVELEPLSRKKPPVVA
ncbi:MMPL family transporter [Rariglobus hedericola]|uniref:MMPL family transporter n=1 Tax=Rariglobus hedericola TaxID=2597822 RepID=A0A556QN90_9BACT|nr:MMPL family transporter [Rariglobus hedericola]TSJ78103.1 MMPL family transporter [Rariglobus hedericola]